MVISSRYLCRVCWSKRFIGMEVFVETHKKMAQLEAQIRVVTQGIIYQKNKYALRLRANEQKRKTLLTALQSLCPHEEIEQITSNDEYEMRVIERKRICSRCELTECIDRWGSFRVLTREPARYFSE